MTPRLDLFSSDGSIFTNEPLEVILPEYGVIQYKVSDNVIKHAGKVDAKLFLANEKIVFTLPTFISQLQIAE